MSHVRYMRIFSSAGIFVGKMIIISRRPNQSAFTIVYAAWTNPMLWCCVLTFDNLSIEARWCRCSCRHYHWIPTGVGEGRDIMLTRELYNDIANLINDMASEQSVPIYIYICMCTQKFRMTITCSCIFKIMFIIQLSIYYTYCGCSQDSHCPCSIPTLEFHLSACIVISLSIYERRCADA